MDKCIDICVLLESEGLVGLRRLEGPIDYLVIVLVGYLMVVVFCCVGDD